MQQFVLCDLFIKTYYKYYRLNYKNIESFKIQNNIDANGFTKKRKNDTCIIQNL